MRSLALGAVLAVTLGLSGAQGQVEAGTTAAEQRLDGRFVPDISLQLIDGRTSTLSALSGADGALFVVFFYGRCTGVCLPLLEWLRDAAADVGGLGEDYRIVALSFDDRDTVESLRQQARVLHLDRDPAWYVAVTTSEALAAITGAFDFWYRPSHVAGQIDHEALFAAVRGGRVIGTRLGAPGDDRRFRELLWELLGRPVLTYAIDDAPPVRCLTYDPRTGGWRLHWGLLLLVAPAVCALTAAMWIFRPRASDYRGA